jgi:uncharacterized protein YmfQ (DUF2313 family)
MSLETEKFERLIIMAGRLVQAIEADIDALRHGQPQQMRSLDPEVQKLLMLYTREVQGIDPVRSKSAPAEMKKRLAAVTAKFRDALGLQQRLLTRMRNASEGIVKAVADEVQRQRAPTITYAPAQAQNRYRQTSVPMIFNGVV